MKRITKIISTVVTLVICIVALVIGVSAQVQLTYAISGNIEYVVAGCQIEVSAVHISGAVSSTGVAYAENENLFTPRTIYNSDEGDYNLPDSIDLYYNDFRKEKIESVANIVLKFTFTNISHYSVSFLAETGTAFKPGGEYETVTCTFNPSTSQTILPQASLEMTVTLELTSMAQSIGDLGAEETVFAFTFEAQE